MIRMLYPQIWPTTCNHPVRKTKRNQLPSSSNRFLIWQTRRPYLKNNSILSSRAFGLLFCYNSNLLVSMQCTAVILSQQKLLGMLTELPLLFQRSKAWAAAQQSLSTASPHSDNSNAFTCMPSLALITSAQDRKLCCFQPIQCRKHSQVLEIPLNVIEKL